MIPVTKTVGTPGNLDLCSGKAVFLINGSGLSLPLGYQTNFSLISNPNVDCGGQFFAGICGPAWAMRMEIAGGVAGQTLTLDPPTYECNAGTLCGVNAVLDFSCHGSVMFIDFGFDLAVNIDILYWLVKAYQAATGRQLLPEEPNRGTAERKSFGVNDAGGGTLGSNLSIKRSPALVIQWDLWPLVLAAQPGALQAWEEVKYVFDIAFGPEIKMTLNVNLAMKSVTVNGVQYTGLVYNDATTKITGTTTSPTEPATADSVSVTFHEVPSIDFGFGFFLEFKFIQVISLGVSIDFMILRDLGYSLIGEYDQTVDSASVAAACIPCSGQLADAGVYEVEFV